MYKTLSNATSDIRNTFRLYRVWLALAKEDIGDQHRRTTLGPFWLLLNYLAFVGTFVFVFHGGNFDSSYAAYIAVGLLVWFYISEVIGHSISLFAREESFIKGTVLPLPVYVMRLTTQSVIRGGYEIVGCMVLLAICGVGISYAWLWSGLGILVIIIVTPAASLIFAFIGVFFPDSQYIVTNLMRVGMFLSPVFWTHGGESTVQSAFYYWNPFTYFLEIVRAPILSGVYPGNAFAVTITIGVVLWVVAMLVLGRYRKEVVFFL